MAPIREIVIPDEVLDLASGRYVRPERVERVRNFLDQGGTWQAEAVADSLVEEMLATRHT
ncbi:MAG: hypothetical protein ACLGHT_10675 [Acidimicrobiia bacterium]